mgnify:CR=1 FL=1
MIKNHLKIALRILWKNKLFSVVNILSLSLSMAVGVILFTGLKATHDTDHFHPKFNQIVRLLTQETNGVEQTKWATTPLPLDLLIVQKKPSLVHLIRNPIRNAPLVKHINTL